MIGILDRIIIGPLRLIFEFIFSISYEKLTGSLGLSIVTLSFVLNVLLLPLYKKADEIQAEENDIQNKMKPDIDFIKKTFSGDEQFLLLQTYYRQHNYKPIYALRSSISLLLQIPFFIAAYSFLSNLQLLEGASFGPFINDLSKPDGLLFGLNLFPILMTLINIVSCIVYTKGQPLKSQLQLYIMALLFLILLYNAPSALSFYYLLNNLFSLIKNVFSKINISKRNKSYFIILLLFLFVLFINFKNISLRVKLLVDILFILAIVIYYLNTNNVFTSKLNNLDISKDSTTFLLCTIYMFILTGLLIPSSVIGASPEEFISKSSLINPLRYVFMTSMIALGLFVLWLNIFHALLDKKNKALLNIVLWTIIGVSTVCYLLFNNNLGTISTSLIYDSKPAFSFYEIMNNLFAIFLCFVIFLYLYIHYKKYINNLLLIICIVALILSSVNIFNINKRSKEAIIKITNSIDYDEQILPLSKTQKNVIVIMLDRAISYYFPYILNEKPILKEQFAGFTFYPNTISFGGYTNTGSPGLYGGYEYIPEEMNKRSNELLADKHNEALKVMPVLFSENNYRVVVTDPPFAGYDWVPDLSIYDGYDDISAYITNHRFDISQKDLFKKLERNLFVYSLSVISPSILLPTIYNDGNYLSFDSNYEDYTDTFKSWYEVLKHLDYMTYITEDDKGSLLLIQNCTAHEPVYLSETDYEIDYNIDQTNNDTHKHLQSINGDSLDINGIFQISHYDVNMAAMMKLGDWFDYLRENDLYNNSRIIIVSDHGRDLYLDKNLVNDSRDFLLFNAFLLYKDFDSNEFVISDDFMTNADTPYLATNNLLNDCINPFTNTPIDYVDKTNKEFNVYSSDEFDVLTNNGYTFIEDDEWYSVHDNCLDINNWKEVDNPSK